MSSLSLPAIVDSFPYVRLLPFGVTSETITDMYWTPGWGNAATISVALLGIGISALYNRRTLSAAANRYSLDRDEEYNAKVRDSIIAVMSASIDWTTAVSAQVKRKESLAAALETGDTVKAGRWKAIIFESDESIVRPAQSTLLTALMGSILLTAEDSVARPVNAMLRYAFDARPLINELDYSDPAAIREVAADLRTIKGAMNECQEYLFETARTKTLFPPSDNDRKPLG